MGDNRSEAKRKSSSLCLEVVVFLRLLLRRRCTSKQRESNLPEWLSRHDNIICSSDMVSGQMSISLCAGQFINVERKGHVRSSYLLITLINGNDCISSRLSRERKEKIKNICSIERKSESLLMSLSKPNASVREREREKGSSDESGALSRWSLPWFLNGIEQLGQNIDFSHSVWLLSGDRAIERRARRRTLTKKRRRSITVSTLTSARVSAP